jgi:serine protease Do
MTAFIAAMSLVPGMVYVKQDASAAPKQAVAQKSEAAIRVVVDGEEIKFGEATPRAIGGTTMVPFRPLFEALGATVEYDLVHKAVNATKGNTGIELMIGEKIAKKNGAEITMAQAPVLVKGVTYVPLRFVAEALDASVDFDSKERLITIDTGEDSASIMGCGDKTQIRKIK